LSHATAEGPYAGAVKVREPVARPLDVVAVELLLTAGQAFLVGVLLYLAVGFWEDAGVGLGSATAVLVLLGLAVGAAWLYWLLGGVGWPMAAANAPAALFLGFTLVLTWFGDDVFRVGGAPLLLGVAAAVFGVVAGVFLDSPRRWRWDQREKLRPGTKVPLVSETTRTLAAKVPRSLPRRGPKEEPVSELAARIEGSTPPGQPPSADAGAARVDRAGGATTTTAASPDRPAEDDEATDPESEHLTDAPDVAGAPIEVPEAPEPVLPTARLGRSSASSTSSATSEDDEEEGIELPTMVGPKAQRSPWAWAAPPEWNRDEDDEPGSGRP
jgi:hypothetical protein